ncbi:Helix-turn-helix domain-containing protein [Evansella caseinilytica]|uniref:Helix-turn-helix domain-containing protein n=1 Tax=Evansella caseinilytica TaxID=1503961 RepID=A0A1H3SY61_9BACI|nr:AraC family transcriptional regulator [Evansella caseinilytica]SDZ42029.1 Helix-turn-helix domain-containing protein [Evansella caseinilytica]
MGKKIPDKKFIEHQKELASLINFHAKSDGTHATAIPFLRLIRASTVSEPLHSIYDPSLCLIAQGSKVVMLADESYLYDSSSYLVASVHLPVSGQIISATPQEPFLCAQINFSTDEILDIIKHSNQAWVNKSDSGRGLHVGDTNFTLLDAVLRLVHLLDSPNDIPTLAPLYVREVIYRILQEKQGNLIKQFAMIGSHAQCIAKVIQLIQRDFSKPLRIKELANYVNMSTSSLHNQFKKVTAMSPLQYQKLIRLQEARRLLLSGSPEAAAVGFEVGYESPSQFSREYARMFGLPPISDMKHLRDSISGCIGSE